MQTKIIKGDKLQAKIFAELKTEIETIRNDHNKVPGIAFIGFLNVPLGKVNIPYHVRSAEALGFKVFNKIQPDDIAEEELFAVVDSLNNDDEVHAIEVLQPLPPHLNPLRIINRVYPDKEVEGFHPIHLMETMFPDLEKIKYPMCLPTALAELFRDSNIEIKSESEWILVMDDEFFENPLVNMVTRTAFQKAVPKDCPITIVNKKTGSVAAYCKRADYLVVVTKEPGFIKPEWINPGVIIIDIYSNLLSLIPSKKNPEKLLPVIRGGVFVEEVANIAGAVVPIPGGLMSVVMAIMFRNAITAFKNSLQTN